MNACAAAYPRLDRAAREAVATGPLFARRDRGFYVRDPDGCDVLAALLRELGHPVGPIAGPTYAARLLGIVFESHRRHPLTGAITIATNRHHPEVVGLAALSDAGDAGRYADRDLLTRDLLGGDRRSTGGHDG